MPFRVTIHAKQDQVFVVVRTSINNCLDMMNIQVIGASTLSASAGIALPDSFASCAGEWLPRHHFLTQQTTEQTGTQKCGRAMIALPHLNGIFMEPVVGVEPTTCCLRNRMKHILLSLFRPFRCGKQVPAKLLFTQYSAVFFGLLRSSAVWYRPPS